MQLYLGVGGQSGAGTEPRTRLGKGSICGGMQRHGRVLSKGVKGPDFPIISRTPVSLTKLQMECEVGCEEASAGMGMDQTSMSHPQAGAGAGS